MARYRNNYHCEACDQSWGDDSNYTNNDKCPECNKEIEPESSDDLEEEFDEENIPVMLSARERDAILCGLRNLQVSLNNSGGAVDDLPPDLRELMTCDGEHSGMESDDIDFLCERINVGPPDEGEANPVYEKGYAAGLHDGRVAAIEDGEAPARALLQDILDYRRDAFENDAPISGADVTDYFLTLRDRVKALLAGAPEPAKYLLILWGDVEPQLVGPFETDEARLEAARAHRRNESGEDGLYILDAVTPASVAPFTGGVLDVNEGEG